MVQDGNHNGQVRKRPQACVFCDKVFQRSDVLHRHYKKCSSRGTAPIPQPLKRGKRRRACDLCARSKLSCDFDSPCETCLMNGVVCTYFRVKQEISQDEILQSTFLMPERLSTISDLYRTSTVGEINRAILVAITQIPRASLTSVDQRLGNAPFLLNYVDPTVRSVTDTFGYTAGSPGDSDTLDPAPAGVEARLSLSFANHPAMLQSTPFGANEVPDLLQAANSDDQQLLEYFFPGQYALEHQLGLEISLDQDRSWFADPLPAAWNINNRLTDDLMYHLQEFCEILPAGHPECSPNNNLTQGLDLISPSNITKFVNLYFHHWNRHSPIIHCATFDPEKASLPLLFAIILTGALFSSQNEATKARALLSLAQEYAFQNKPFKNLLAGKSPRGCDEEQASRDALQAAFSVAQVQLREGSAGTRKNARSIRFGQVINAARTAGLMNARNRFFASPKEQSEQFGWDIFTHSEASIRFICGLFALDTSFMVFYNLPPRISEEELKTDMPCSLESYLAKDAEACHETATDDLEFHLPRVNDILALYLGDQPEPHMALRKKSFSVLDFYVIILIILRKIWTLTLHEVHIPEEPTRRALSRWKSDWDTYTTKMTPQQSELSGFMMQASVEFWHFCNIVLTQASQAYFVG